MARVGGRGGRDHSKLVLFVTTVMAEYSEHVANLEATATDRRAVWPVDEDERLRRRLVLENLVDLSHVVHRSLRDLNPVVREAAQWLTIGSARLIGRMCVAFGVQKLGGFVW